MVSILTYCAGSLPCSLWRFHCSQQSL